MRMPPSASDNNRRRYNAFVADHMLVDHIDIVELAVLNRQDGCVANTGRFETAELGALDGHGGIDSGCGDEVTQRHPEAKELREGSRLVERRAVDAQGMDVGGDGVRIKAVGQHAARGLEGK